MGVRFFCNKCGGEIFKSITKTMKATTTILVIDELCVCPDCLAEELNLTKPMKVKVIAVSPESLWHRNWELLEQKTVFPKKILKRYRNGDVKGFFVINVQGRQRQIFISRVRLENI